MTADSERLADLLELAQDWLWEVDAEGRFVYLSPGAAADLGVPAEALIGRPWRQAVPPRGGVEAWERHLATLAARAPFRDTLLPLYDGDGSSRTLRCSGKPLFDADGAFRGYRGIARDATEAMLAERKYRALFEHAPIGISVEDLTGQYLDSNPALAAMLGFTDAEMAEMSHLAVTAPEGLMQYLPRVAEMMAGERPRVDVTVRQRRKDGGALWVRLCAAPIRDLQGTPRQVVCMAVDISDLIGAQEMLLRRHIAIESSVDGIAICDAAGRLTYLNGAQAQLYGYDGPDAMVGLAWSALYGDGEGERFRHEIRAALAAEGRWRGEAAGRRRDGAEFPQELSLTALEGGGFVAITRDITARRRAEAEQAQLRERMHRSQRLDALGRLASGVAHDFNNVLAAILNYAGVLEQEVPPGHPLREAVEAIRGAGDHGVALVRQILGLSRSREAAKRPIRFDGVVASCLPMLAARVPSGAALDGGALAPAMVLGDDTQLRQVVLNLAGNAIQALGPEGGSVRVALAVETLPAGWAAPLAAATAETLIAPMAAEDISGGGTRLWVGRPPAAGAYARLSVRDTGIGMPRRVLERIFEPFFTTKGQGEGSGIGLAAVLGIIVAHDGLAVVESRPGGGTDFAVLLPLLPEGAAAEPAAREHILVLDPDAAAADATAAALRRLGYRVTIADDVAEAADAALAVAAAPLAPALRDLRPGLAVLALEAPLPARLLARAVRRALDGA